MVGCAKSVIWIKQQQQVVASGWNGRGQEAVEFVEVGFTGRQGDHQGRGWDLCAVGGGLVGGDEQIYFDFSAGGDVAGVLRYRSGSSSNAHHA